ncbi:MAG TPA: XkdF-like putative serine protease domain-containing protein [Nocardioides sp.]|nr:XkdF-like putative serine protease domain-containing protein [Nocardioides sp.]
MPEQRFLLTVGYQAGPDPRIQRGADGYRDYFTSEELEKAAWSLLRSGAPTCGLFHMDGTEGAAEIVESMIWRADPWLIKAVDGTEVTVKFGDWLAGLLCDQTAWDLYKRGRIGGVSPQGAAKRRRGASLPSVAREFVMAKSIAPGSEDDEEMTELYDALVPRLDLVGKGANGMPFLIAKSASGAPGGLFEADFVRELIAKATPTPESDPRETVTLSGSAAAIAALIHSAPVRKGELAQPDEVEKADLSTKDLNDLPDSAFAYIEPGGTKDSEGKTTPRKLRHFAIHDKAHADNAAARIAQGAKFGDKAKAKVEAAQRKFGEDVSKEINMAVATAETDTGVDGMDPTVVLAEPDDDSAPGNPGEPGSPAWEQIDAATARKWTSIAVRLKNALGVMADREMLEAASADPNDAEAAWDLQDAQCALDYVIDTLAGFAVEEQAEADFGSEAMDAIGKALAGFDPAPLDLFEGLAPLTKAGRVLSSANEAAIRGAVESLQKVLASLPAAPPAEEPATPVEKESAVIDTEQPEAAPAPQEPAPEAPVEKAKGDPQLVVYDQKGKLLGIVDPGDLTPVANGESSEGGDAPADETTTTDPAGTTASTSGAAVIPGTNTVASPPLAADDDQVTKAVQAGLAPLLAEVLAPLTKQITEQAERNQALADRLADQAAVSKALQERVEYLAKMPDDRKPPLLNGATGTAGMATRDGTALDPYTDLEKAVAEASDPGVKRDAEQRLAYAKVRDRFIR